MQSYKKKPCICKAFKSYSLTLRMEKEKVWITRKEEWGGSCEYASFIKFLENWTDINTQYD